MIMIMIENILVIGYKSRFWVYPNKRNGVIKDVERV